MRADADKSNAAERNEALEGEIEAELRGKGKAARKAREQAGGGAAMALP
jgi:hypothetical protein